MEVVKRTVLMRLMKRKPIERKESSKGSVVEVAIVCSDTVVVVRGRPSEAEEEDEAATGFWSDQINGVDKGL